MLLGMNSSRIQQIVVTGASGFVGKALLSTLAQYDLEVVGLYRTSELDCCCPKNVRLQRVAEYEAYVPQGSVGLVHLAENRQLDLAASENPEIYVRRVKETTHKILDKGWSHVVYASSSAVYDDKAEHFHQVDEEVSPRGVYGQTKVACEGLVRSVGGASLRFSNIFGPGMADNNVLSDILRQLHNPGPLVLRNLNSVRNYIWIADAVDALATVALSQAQGIFNIGASPALSVRDLCNLILKFVDQESRELIETLPSANVSCLKMDFCASEKQLGWSPQTSIADGLRKLVGSTMNLGAIQQEA
jgi:nucleoside-diphosphate-sugar epimerase